MLLTPWILLPLPAPLSYWTSPTLDTLGALGTHFLLPFPRSLRHVPWFVYDIGFGAKVHVWLAGLQAGSALLLIAWRLWSLGSREENPYDIQNRKDSRWLVNY